MFVNNKLKIIVIYFDNRNVRWGELYTQNRSGISLPLQIGHQLIA